MKIGEFSKKYQVPIDTVRYYIKLGLLLPEQKGQFYFNHTCVEDMELIQELKRYHFTLKEIHKILSFKRVTSFNDMEDKKYYMRLLTRKKEELCHEIQDRQRSIGEIEEKIVSLDTEIGANNEGIPCGISPSFIALLYCPYCFVNLDLHHLFIREGGIVSGKLECRCSYIATIQDGILITPDHYNVYPDIYNVSLCIYDYERFEQFSSDFITLAERGYSRIHKYLMKENHKPRTMIETNVNDAAFLPKYINSLSDENLYIFSCYSVETLQKLRKRIEQSKPDIQALYIANNNMKFPLKPNSIDVVIDSFSVNDISLFYNFFPIERLRSYLKDHVKVLGTHVYYDQHANSIRKINKIFPNPHARTYYPSYLKDNLEDCGFDIVSKEYIGSSDKPGDFFIYHATNEKLHMCFYIAEVG
ncbi:MerR family transcriptional regulator [Ammoniphilus sp. CFH 90114]|uniref:MerR family transcriptional regulator n=1 Tax=Ammoniphilus sp. CFH 90114 TaxID=2493665 RepID=UPI0013E962BF|nr:MerR family transcriptional regulator [Ammoniphilus sp. CFH 90114]